MLQSTEGMTSNEVNEKCSNKNQTQLDEIELQL